MNEFINEPVFGNEPGKSCAYCNSYESDGHDDLCELAIMLKHYISLIQQNSELKIALKVNQQEHEKELAAEDKEAERAVKEAHELGYRRGIEFGQNIAGLNCAVADLQLELKKANETIELQKSNFSFAQGQIVKAMMALDYGSDDSANAWEPGLTAIEALIQQRDKAQADLKLAWELVDKTNKEAAEAVLMAAEKVKLTAIGVVITYIQENKLLNPIDMSYHLDIEKILAVEVVSGKNDNDPK